MKQKMLYKSIEFDFLKYQLKQCYRTNNNDGNISIYQTIHIFVVNSSNLFDQHIARRCDILVYYDYGMSFEHIFDSCISRCLKIQITSLFGRSEEEQCPSRFRTLTDYRNHNTTAIIIITVNDATSRVNLLQCQPSGISAVDLCHVTRDPMTVSESSRHETAKTDRSAVLMFGKSRSTAKVLLRLRWRGRAKERSGASAGE